MDWATEDYTQTRADSFYVPAPEAGRGLHLAEDCEGAPRRPAWGWQRPNFAPAPLTPRAPSSRENYRATPEGGLDAVYGVAWDGRPRDDRLAHPAAHSTPPGPTRAGTAAAAEGFCAGGPAWAAGPAGQVAIVAFVVLIAALVLCACMVSRAIASLEKTLFQAALLARAVAVTAA